MFILLVSVMILKAPEALVTVKEVIFMNFY